VQPLAPLESLPMNILECDIEDLVFNSKNEILLSRGLDLCRNKQRQVRLGSYGIADVICWELIEKYNRKIKIQIVELKKEVIDCNALMQACRYQTAIQQIIDRRNFNNTEFEFEVILIGKKIQEHGDFVFTLNTFKNIKCYTYSLDTQFGLKFYREYDYKFSNPILPEIKISRDKYIIDFLTCEENPF